MEYLLNINDIQSYNIIYKKPVKNQDNKYINFYKLLYSNAHLNLKYLLINIPFENYNIINTNKCFMLQIDKCDEFYNYIRYIEELVLQTANMNIDKNIIYNCYYEMYNKPYIYCFQKYPVLKNLVLKISGVWEDEYNIGLVYKIHYNTSTEKF